MRFRLLKQSRVKATFHIFETRIMTNLGAHSQWETKKEKKSSRNKGQNSMSLYYLEQIEPSSDMRLDMRSRESSYFNQI